MSHREARQSILLCPYERPQNSVEIAIFRVAKEGLLKLSRSSGNDAELLFLCSRFFCSISTDHSPLIFNSVSEFFFVDSQRSGIKKQIAQRRSFHFFLFGTFFVEPAGAFFGFDRVCLVQIFFGPAFMNLYHLDLVRMPSAGSLGVLRECHLTSVPWSGG